ncbi:MAG: 7-carboxy-7-deazaguanine synthase QueE [Deltaproteobacteria bacterium]|nr:7-carboxy-7-deazaguanine synthase QueE [Deltaproteobacteria bacterium]
MTAASPAIVHEVFSSLQGEGPHVGEPMTFLRFQGCALRCRWCDTPAALSHAMTTFRVESPPRSWRFNALPNPIAAEALTEILAAFPDDTIALTGGEPLEQAAFLAEWLPTCQPRRRILLETAGVMTTALTTVLPFVDIVSMDLKLPSSTGMKAYWSEHTAFIEAAVRANKEVYCKMIVTGRTTPADIASAIHLVQHTAPKVPMIIQPASPTATFADAPASAQIAAVVQQCRARLPNVRMIPQMHKQWGVL